MKYYLPDNRKPARFVQKLPMSHLYITEDNEVWLVNYEQEDVFYVFLYNVFRVSGIDVKHRTYPIIP